MCNTAFASRQMNINLLDRDGLKTTTERLQCGWMTTTLGKSFLLADMKETQSQTTWLTADHVRGILKTEAASWSAKEISSFLSHPEHQHTTCFHLTASFVGSNNEAGSEDHRLGNRSNNEADLKQVPEVTIITKPFIWTENKG